MPRDEARARLLSWYEAHRRALPWRETTDPYAIWVSEVMLQQTRVETVRGYYSRFLARFPTVEALAAAEEAEVQARWAGLGYYRRAALMQRAARVLVEEHGGRLPADLQALRALPGFGAYTSAAVASIAFGIPAAAIDGNVRRVLSRYAGIEGEVSRGAPARALEEEAERWLRADAAGALTQALMELGATRCLPRGWRCEDCPLSAECVALKGGRQAELPAPKPRPKVQEVKLHALLLSRDGATLLSRQPSGGLYAGQWCPPFSSSLDALKERWPNEGLSAVGDFSHRLTHRLLQVRVYTGRLQPKVAVDPPHRLCRPEGYARLGLPRFSQLALKQAP